MSAVRCPSGHESSATDYCDVCGAPIAPVQGAGAGELDLGTPPPAAPGPAAAAGGAGPEAGAQTCPHCGTVNSPTALFCEACGYDFTTGTLPRSGAPAPAGPAPAAPPVTGPVAPAVPLEWVVEVWVDPDWYAEQDSPEPCPSPGLPVVLPLRVRSLLVGRTSTSRNIHPEIACESDSAVSRRHAQLSTDGTRWWVEDLNSSNGTFVGPASGPLPTQPLVPGQRRELAEDDRIYVGAWTRLVVRRATDEEKGAG